MRITDPRAVGGLLEAQPNGPLKITPPEGGAYLIATLGHIAEGRKGEVSIESVKNRDLTVGFRRDDGAVAVGEISLPVLDPETRIGLMANAMNAIEEDPGNVTAGDVMKALAGIPKDSPPIVVRPMPRGWKIRWADGRSTSELPEEFVPWEGLVLSTIVDHLCRLDRREWHIRTAWGEVILAREPAPGTGTYALDDFGLPVPYGEPEL